MTGPILKLNGIDEGILVSLETKLSGADLPERVYKCITNLFPNFSIDESLTIPSLGAAKEQIINSSNLSMATFLEQLHKQRILDTALDSMSQNLKSDESHFHISRQAALSGKISFNLPGEFPLGGSIKITLKGDNLEDWIEAATWHSGRDSIPRSINDERSMSESGESSIWI
ncbi:MAG: hypothetical protein CMA81_02040 [Euryarchaeota archaeon]|nr:hypothetical protein [Euryarchaeota archaeon]